MLKIDPFTGEEFISKRLNQKFASRNNQIMYNNYLAKKRRDFKLDYLQIIDRNYVVLDKVLGKSKLTKCTIGYLKGAGFDFNFHTHQARIEGGVYAMIYDCGICRLEEGNFQIIKK